MPKSLRCKIKKLCYNGELTERERDRILKALDQEETQSSSNEFFNFDAPMVKNSEKQLIDELSKMALMVIETAYLHALNYTLYGVDVTEKWVTATQNASALEKAHRKGYYDALQMQVESEE